MSHLSRSPNHQHPTLPPQNVNTYQYLVSNIAILSEQAHQTLQSQQHQFQSEISSWISEEQLINNCLQALRIKKQRLMKKASKLKQEVIRLHNSLNYHEHEENPSITTKSNSDLAINPKTLLAPPENKTLTQNVLQKQTALATPLSLILEDDDVEITEENHHNQHKKTTTQQQHRGNVNHHPTSSSSRIGAMSINFDSPSFAATMTGSRSKKE